MAGPAQRGNDREFVADLRAAAERYLAAVDAWETGYRKYYRVTGPGTKVSTDLQPHEEEFVAAKKKLEALVPRARALCFQHGLKEPWTVLMKTSLGQYAPQDRNESGVSRTERRQVNECLVMLAEVSAGFTPDVPETRQPRRGRLQRILDWFY